MKERGVFLTEIVTGIETKEKKERLFDHDQEIDPEIKEATGGKVDYNDLIDISI